MLPFIQSFMLWLNGLFITVGFRREEASPLLTVPIL